MLACLQNTRKKTLLYSLWFYSCWPDNKINRLEQSHNRYQNYLTMYFGHQKYLNPYFCKNDILINMFYMESVVTSQLIYSLFLLYYLYNKYILSSVNNIEFKVACLISSDNYFILMHDSHTRTWVHGWPRKIIMQTNQWSSTALPEHTYSQKSYLWILQLLFIVSLPITIWY